MSEIHLRHIYNLLKEKYAPLVDVSDVENRPQDVVEACRMSRALAAFVLSYEAAISPEISAIHVVDGYDDNGIDAIYYEKNEGCLHLVQSKWSRVGRANPSKGDLSKFADGLRDPLSFKMDSFNDKIRGLSDEISEALDQVNLRFQLTLVYTGAQQLPISAMNPINRLLEEMNDISEVVFFQSLNQQSLYRSVVNSTRAGPIDLEVVLREWGRVVEPYEAYYGQVALAEAAHWWAQHHNALFARNLRMFMRDTQINSKMAETLKRAPQHFWYFNNGVTVLCEEVQKKPKWGSDRKLGAFVCKGATIVNGAQTLGNIGRYPVDDANVPATVLVRIISLKDCPDDFDREITTATNTQNRIEARDFAALDPQQERIANELALDNVRYVYKVGEDAPIETGFTIEDATVALACSHDDIRLAVQAKGQIGVLWEDTSSAPYTRLFNEDVDSESLWAKVQQMWNVNKAIEALQGQSDGLLRQVFIHGNRFLLRQVYRQERIAKAPIIPPSLRSFVVGAADFVLRYSERNLAGTYLAWTFKNLSKCKHLEYALDQWIDGRGLDPIIQRGKVADPAIHQKQLVLEFPKSTA